MSLQLINHNQDLRRLLVEGYDIEIRHNHLLVHGVPYLNSKKEIRFGTLISNLSIADNVTKKPDPHTVFFDGEFPCNVNGTPLDCFAHSVIPQPLANDLLVNYQFSARPPNGYDDYFQKITTYEAMLSGPVQLIDSKITARAFHARETREGESVFKYYDTASARAGIFAITQKLEQERIAIIGLGGTGSYVLDFVAKTPVKEIHLFDGDRFLNHNAFRAPGAPSGAELQEQPFKTDYFARHYSNMRRAIHSHPEYANAENIEQLKGMTFVFLCLDKGAAKSFIIDRVEEYGIPFVDVGLGVIIANGSLCGTLTTTSSTPNHREYARKRIPLSDGEVKNEYDQNIQIAELNALNATLAVIKWKKLVGFYLDSQQEHFTTYTTDGNHVLNEDIE